MAKQIEFDPNGDKLWIKIEMYGLYLIMYTYTLYGIDPKEPAVLTNPPRHGSNATPHEDSYQIINDYNTAEALSRNNGRTILAAFTVRKLEDDNGYHLRASIIQGPSVASGKFLGSDDVFENLGTQSSKEEFITFQLVS